MESISNVKISIIMPAYNASKNIQKSIDSVLSQTYKNWELFIINDCSTDNTLGIIQEYRKSDNRIKLINLEENSGVANARNQGIKRATGSLVAFLDSDDYWTKNKLKKQRNFMLVNNYKFTYSNFHVVNDEGVLLDTRIAPNKSDYKTLLKSNHIGCLTVMVDTQLIKENLMKTIGHEDYLTWLSILKKEIIAYNTNETLGYYRISKDSLSGSKIKAAKWQWNIYTNELGISKISSSYYFLIYLYNGLKKSISAS